LYSFHGLIRSLRLLAPHMVEQKNGRVNADYSPGHIRF
jgi:hypothetical protein